MQTSAHWDLLMALHCSQKTTFHFLSVLTSTHLFYQRETIFVGYFWLVTNALKIYFSDVSETSQNKHLFEMYLRHLREVTKDTSFLRCIWDFSFEMFPRRFWDGDLTETSQTHLMPAGNQWKFQTFSIL